MRKLFLLASMATITITMISFWGCQKETLSNNDTMEVQAIMSTSIFPNAQVTNGMLEVQNLDEISQITAYLAEEEKKENSLTAAYDQLEISQETRDELGAYTRHPVCKTFEQQKGYLSARTKEEDWKFAEAIETNFETSTSLSVLDPFFKTVLNQYNAVKVGKRILMYFETGELVVIANEDFNAYNSIKNLPIEQISDAYNIRVISQESDELHEIDDLGNTTNTKYIKNLRLHRHFKANGFVTLLNNSLIEYMDGSDAIFHWTFQDGTTYTGNNPDRDLALGETCTLIYGNDANGWTTVQESAVVCTVSVSVTKITDNKFKFTVAYSGPLTIQWTFGDGTTATGNNVTHEFTTSGTFNVKMLILEDDGSRYCEKDLTVNVIANTTCSGKTDKDTDTYKFETSNGAKFRMEVAIWVNLKKQPNNTWTSCGASINVFKRTQIKKYSYSFNGVDATVSGKYLNKADCEERSVSTSTNGWVTNSNIEIYAGTETTGTKNPVKISGALEAAFKCRILINGSGEIFDYPGVLVLN